MPHRTRRPRFLALRRASAALGELQRRAEAMASGDFQSRGLPVGGSAALEDLRRALDVIGEHMEQAQHTAREYIAALTAAQEAERGRLARELHDDTVQQLIVLAQGVDRIQRVHERTPERVPEHLATLRGDITTLIQTLRTTIANLRPPALAELGLVPAVQLFAQPWATAMPIRSPSPASRAGSILKASWPCSGLSRSAGAISAATPRPPGPRSPSTMSGRRCG